MSAPIITAGQVATGKVGTAFSFSPALTDSANRPVTSWSATGLPAGLTLNTGTGAISGTPTTKGVFSASITATGEGGVSQSEAVTLTSAPSVVSGSFSVAAVLNAADAILIGGNAPEGSFWTGTYLSATAQNKTYHFGYTFGGNDWLVRKDVNSGVVVAVAFMGAGSKPGEGNGFASSNFDELYWGSSIAINWEYLFQLDSFYVAGSIISITGSSYSSPSGTRVSFTIAEGVPIITAGQTASGKVGTAFSKTFALTDSANRPVTSWSATGLPSWATLNTTTGAITGTPQDAGSTTVTLTATGPGGTDTETAVISIAVGPPIITAGQSFTGRVGVAFVQSIALEDALDRPATSWTRTSGTIPAGLTLNASTGAISGTPTTKGSFTASFTATGDGGTSAATSVSFTIAEGAPIITAGQTASGKVGTAFSKTFALTNSANRPVTSWSATGLPSWATLNTTTGAITGTPQDAGSTTVTLTATGPGGTDTETAVISIAVGPPIITAGQSFTGRVGVAFSQAIALTDSANRPVTSWSATGLPAGLTLNASTGAISGTPTTKGSFTASFTATGGGGTSAATSVSFTIAEGVPIIAGEQIVVGRAGVGLGFVRLDLMDATNRPAALWEVVEGVLPGGLALNGVTGEIFGTPVAFGESVVAVTAGNSAGVSAAVSVQIAIAEGVPLHFLLEVGRREAFSLPVSNVATWTLAAGSALPPGLSLDAVSGEISGVVYRPGMWAMAVVAESVGGVSFEVLFVCSVSRSVSRSVTRRVVVNTQTWEAVMDDAGEGFAGKLRFNDLVTFDIRFVNAAGQEVYPDVARILFAVRGLDTEPTFYQTRPEDYRRVAYMNADDSSLRYARRHLVTAELMDSAMGAFLSDVEADEGTKRRVMCAFEFVFCNNFYNRVSTKNFFVELTRDTI